jgi:hypothetical protein
MTVNGRGVEVAVGVGTGASPGVRHPVRSKSRATAVSTRRVRVLVPIELLHHSRQGGYVQFSQRTYVEAAGSPRNVYSVRYGNDERPCRVAGAAARLGILENHTVSWRYPEGRARLFVRLRMRLATPYLVAGDRHLESALR